MIDKIIKNNPDNNYNKELARCLRRSQSICEKYFWSLLRNNYLLGYKFRRQFPIDKYVVDFFSYKLNLIIEIDGPVHDNSDNINNDKKRQKILEKYGYNVMRFKTTDIMNNDNKVLDELKSYIESKHKSELNNN